MDNEMPAEIRTAAIIGLGLIGGSMARDMAARGVEVFGWDQDPEAVQKAVDAGAVHESLLDDPSRVCEGEVVLIAVPVLTAPRLLRDFAPHLESARLITDAGSTKSSIVRTAEALEIGDRFVGSHPLAGDHRSGWDASRTGLFADARVYLCPTASTTKDAMHTARKLWTMVDGKPEVIDAAGHDRRLAWTSHLPQLVSSALGGALAGQGIERGELGPGGRDVTRLAGSDPDMWADIMVDNADALASAFGMMGSRLSAFSRAVANRDREALRGMLAKGREWHRQEG
jgi:prephenate dehydrogenase